MSSYKRIIISSILSLNLGLNLFANELKIAKDDIPLYETQFILFALEYEDKGYVLNAKDMYKKLYELKKSDEYLFKYLQMSARLNDFKTIINEVKNIKTENLAILELYAYALSMNKDYKKAVEVLEKVYVNNKDENIVLGLANLYENNLDQKQKAMNLLEKHVLDDLNSKLTLRLLIMYEKNKEFQKALDLLKKLYVANKNSNPIFFERSKKILVSYFYNIDPKDGISFFKEHEKDNIDIIVSFYKKLGDLDGVYSYLNNGYKQTKDLNYLAQIAMYDYETAKNKDDILEDVIKKFEKVLEKHENAVYQNYLAYILIDHDINIDNGVGLVKEALKKQPEDIAFLDTLAWGVYKQNDCKKAYDIMKSIVDKIGIQDEEIKFHWEKIKECSK